MAKVNKKSGICHYCKDTVAPGEGETWVWAENDKRYYRHTDCRKNDHRGMVKEEEVTPTPEVPAAPTFNEEDSKGDGTFTECACGHAYSKHAIAGNSCRVIMSNGSLCYCCKFTVPIQDMPSAEVEWAKFWTSDAYDAWLGLLPADLRPFVANRLLVPREVLEKAVKVDTPSKKENKEKGTAGEKISADLLSLVGNVRQRA